MSTPFSDDIIGSWLFTRSSQTPFIPRIVYHYTASGKCYFETDHDGQRTLAPAKYRFAGSTLTLVYSSGTERDFVLAREEDGSVMIPGPKGTWWMIRLTTPEPYSRAFVDEHGLLHELQST
jgi:hypothetical protein